MGGLGFGKLAFVRNVIYVRVSPYELKGFPHFFKKTWTGFRRDFNSVFPYAAPPLTLGYLVYLWGSAENERLSKKNPKDYENDE